MDHEFPSPRAAAPHAAPDPDTMFLGLLGHDELLPVPAWVVEQLYNPATPQRLRKKGSEDARSYLRDRYGVEGSLTLFWMGSRQRALEYAARYLDVCTPPSAYMIDEAAN